MFKIIRKLIVFLYFSFSLLISCKGKTNVNQNKHQLSFYETKIDSNLPNAEPFKQIVLDARWRYYCMTSGLKFALSDGRKVDYSELEFRFENFVNDEYVDQNGRRKFFFHNTDYLFPLFKAYYKGKAITEIPNILSKSDDDMYYEGKIDSSRIIGLVYFLVDPSKPVGEFDLYFNRFLFDTTNKRRTAFYSRRISINPIQPEVIRYIRNNQSKLHPWFFNEAVSHRVFDSSQFPSKEIDSTILLHQIQDSILRLHCPTCPIGSIVLSD